MPFAIPFEVQGWVSSYTHKPLLSQMSMLLITRVRTNMTIVTLFAAFCHYVLWLAQIDAMLMACAARKAEKGRLAETLAENVKVVAAEHHHVARKMEVRRYFNI